MVQLEPSHRSSSLFPTSDSFRLAVWNSSSMYRAFCKIGRPICLVFPRCTSLQLNQMTLDTITKSLSRSFLILCLNFKYQIRSSNSRKLTLYASEGISDNAQISVLSHNPRIHAHYFLVPTRMPHRWNYQSPSIYTS